MRDMKHSGVQWIGDIPSTWEVRRLKYVLHERKEKNDPVKTDNILSLSATQGVVPYAERRGGGNKPKEDITAYKVVHEGDIVMNSMNVLSGAVNYSRYTGCVSPVYYMFYSNDDVITRYYNLVFQTEPFQKSLRGLGNGILIKETDEGKLNTIRMRIPMEKLNKVLLPVPVYKDIEGIVNNIEPLCSKIDEIIAEATASIEEYKELKQAVIFEAVTKGLDKTVPMKDSNIYYIGNTPFAWQLVKNKYLVRIENGSDPTLDGDIPVYGSGANSFKTCGEYKVGPTVLLGRKGATLHIPHYITGFYWNVDTAFNTVCISDNLHLKFFYYAARCFDYKAYISQTTLPGMTQTSYRNMKIALPPLQEQNAIVDYLDKQIERLEDLISEKQALIDDLQAYKKSLIYEVVTGKRRVV